MADEYDAADSFTPLVLMIEDGRWFDWSDDEGWVLNEEKTAQIREVTDG